jgi:hypothetical protein
MKLTSKILERYKAQQELIAGCVSALRGYKSLNPRLLRRLRECGNAHHRDVFLGVKDVDDGSRKAVRVGVRPCGGDNFCPRCHVKASAERLERTLAICRAHLGTNEKPTLNPRLIDDGLATDDLVPIVMMFTLTVPRRGGEAESEKNVERYEAVRKKFFHSMNPKYYWGKLKNNYRILSFLRVTDVTYQIVGDMKGAHWHGHGLFFALISRLKLEEFSRDEAAKKRFENEISMSMWEEWQRAATNVDSEIKIQKPFREQGKLKGGVVVELARDLAQTSQYVAKSMAFEVAYGVGKIPNADDKHSWGQLVEMISLKDFDGKHVFAEDIRAEAARWYRFHASQASRDQFTIGNIVGHTTIETYYLGSKEEREKKEREEKAEKEAKTVYTHSSSRDAYNSVTKLEVEESVEAYEKGEEVEKVTDVWTKEKRTQEEIRERIDDNEKFVQEKAAFLRWKKGCRTETTLRSAVKWCERMCDWANKRIAEKLLFEIGDSS